MVSTENLLERLKEESKERPLKEREFRRELRKAFNEGAFGGIRNAIVYLSAAVVSYFAIVGGIAGISYLQDRKKYLERIENTPRHNLIEKDINNNSIPEKFYMINGQKVFLEVDGKNLEYKLTGEQQK